MASLIMFGTLMLFAVSSLVWADQIDMVLSSKTYAPTPTPTPTPSPTLLPTLVTLPRQDVSTVRFIVFTENSERTPIAHIPVVAEVEFEMSMRREIASTGEAGGVELILPYVPGSKYFVSINPGDCFCGSCSRLIEELKKFRLLNECTAELIVSNESVAPCATYDVPLAWTVWSDKSICWVPEVRR